MFKEDYIPHVKREDVLRVVERDFPNMHAKEIINLLDKYKVESLDSQARIQLAILKLSDGNIEKLKKYIELALVDYRDVILPAECPEFCGFGFAGIGKVSDGEKEQIKKNDWEQYKKWLNR